MVGVKVNVEKKVKKPKKTKNQKNNNKDLISKCDEIQIKILPSKEETKKIGPPNLLLAYLYHLNVEHSKYVACGFNSKTFTPSLIINDACIGFVELNDMEYTSIFLKSKEINKYFNKYEAHESVDHIVYNPANLIQYIDIKYILIDDVKHITLQIIGDIEKTHRVTLNEGEWIKFGELFGFFNQLIFWYKSISTSVIAYYNHYLKLCADKNQICLGPQEFYSLNDINNEDNPRYRTSASIQQQTNFNYFRLFQEIGFLCTENITLQILKKIYSSK